LLQGDKTALLMDMSDGTWESGLKDYVRVCEYLASKSVRVPEIYFYDETSCLAVIEDLGQVSFGDIVRAGDDRASLYHTATEVLVEIRKHCTANDLDLVELQNSIPRMKLNFFPLDYIPAATKNPRREEDLAEFDAIFNQIMKDATPCTKTLACADYHLENIMKPKSGGDYALIDFQDAMWIQAPYDLVNLLEDARQTVPEDIKAEMKALYCAGMSDEEREGFEHWYVILSMFFHCKVVGQFTKYYLERGLDAYIQHIPRLQNYIVNELEYPIMKPLKDWLADKNVPFDIPLDELLKKS
jgi:aminoglycoside/choline kinase family phosphotransferase